MTRFAWRVNRTELAVRKALGWMVDKLVELAKFFRSPPPEFDESHAETRYRIAQMTREEWEEYERAMFDEACGKNDQE